MFSRTLLSHTALCCVIAASLSGSAFAQGVTVYRAGDRIDPAAIAEILGGSGLDQRPHGVRTRGLQMLDAAGPASTAGAVGAASASMTSLNQPGAAASAGSVSGKAAGSLSLPVQFGFDSAVIFPEARDQLDALAAGIKLIPQERAIVIEGHTDAAGSDAYNLELSRQRAESVKRYLVESHGIQAARLRTIGQGKRAPLDASDPYGPVNRRVQFRGG